MRTWASVQTNTRTISSVRQAMVTLRDASASRRRVLVRGIEAQAPQEVDEIGSRRGDRGFVSEHLDEPGALLGDEDGGEQPALLVAFACELVDGYRAGRARDRLARPGE